MVRITAPGCKDLWFGNCSPTRHSHYGSPHRRAGQAEASSHLTRIAEAVNRLGVGRLLRRSLARTKAIEARFSTLERVVRNVKRWQKANQSLRSTATGLLEAENRFNRINGHREIGRLDGRLNPPMIQQEEVAKEHVASP